MKKYNYFFWILILLITQTTQAQDYFPAKPEPAKYVNDFANFMNHDEIEKLEHKLKAYNDSTSTQIVVVTVENLSGHTISEYANDLARNWGIGQKGSNNGLLILTSKAERKVRIEVGYGLESKITDALSQRIIKEKITPNFKKGDFYQGFEAGIDIVISALAGEVFESNDNSSEDTNTGGFSIIFWILIALPILAIIAFLFVGFMFQREKRQKIQEILEKIERQINPNQWGISKQRYKAEEVTKVLEEFAIKYANVNRKSLEDVSALKEEIWDYINNLEKYFSFSNVYEMEKLGLEVLQNFMQQEIFTLESRSNMHEKIMTEVNKFHNRYEETLTEEEVKQVEANKIFYQKYLDNIFEFLEVDYDFIHTELSKINDNDFWLKYSSSYTKESIQKTQNEFQIKYENITNIEELSLKQEQILLFYSNNFQHFLAQPGVRLKENPKPVTTTYSDTSTYSSSYSYSDSSSSSYSYSDSSSSSYSYSDSSSYSDDSDSYSDFGGGDFGGGGAEGSW